CAFLAPDDIPISVLRTGAGELPDPLRGVLEDQIRTDKAIGALRSYSLVERQEDALRVHRLVQWVVRESLGAEPWRGALVKLLVSVFPSQVEDPEQWANCARLLPHAQALI